MPKITIVVNAAIFDGNKYLLTKRYSPHDELVHGRWQMPGGGLNFKESLINGLKREVREELNVEIDVIIMLRELYESVVERAKWHGIVMTYLCKLKNKHAKIMLNHEATSYGWFSLKEMRAMKLHYGTFKQLSLVDKLRRAKNLL